METTKSNQESETTEGESEKQEEEGKVWVCLIYTSCDCSSVAVL